MSIIYFPKLLNMEQFIDSFKEYIDSNYNVSISREFIETVLKTNTEIDNDLNHITFKDSNNGFNYINTLFKNIFGTPLTNLVYLAVKFKKEAHSQTNKSEASNHSEFLLHEKIKLEKELENSKETIDELRDAYVRVKRENDRLISKNNLR